MTITYGDDELSEFDLEDIAIAARRLGMYSALALEIALPVDQIFINHPAFTQALAGMDRIFQLSTKVAMPHGMRLIGPTGAGKTSLFQYFQRSLPRSSLFAEGLGAIHVRIPKNVTKPYMVGKMLRLYDYAFQRVTSGNVEQRTTVLVDAIRQKGTQLIMFDEAHNLTPRAGGKNVDPEVGTSPTDLIRELIDATGVSTVFAGPRNLDGMVDLDNALAGRVVGCHRFEPFKYDAAWIGLIKGFVQQTRRFDLRVLLERDVNWRLHKATEGNLRVLKRLLTEIVLVAVDGGATVAELAHIQKAYSVIYGMASQMENPFDSGTA